MKLKSSLIAATAVIVISAAVSGCSFKLGTEGLSASSLGEGGTTPTTANALPTLPEYNDEFRNEFADEVDQICGNERLGIEKQYDKSCVFIQDAIVLREQIRTIQARNPS